MSKKVAVGDRECFEVHHEWGLGRYFSGGEILASGAIREAYKHGKGSIAVRGCAFIEGSEAVASSPTPAAAPAAKRGAKKAAKERVTKPSIVITELPYQTNKADFVANIARLVEEQKLLGGSSPTCICLLLHFSGFLALGPGSALSL